MVGCSLIAQAAAVAVHMLLVSDLCRQHHIVHPAKARNGRGLLSGFTNYLLLSVAMCADACLLLLNVKRYRNLKGVSTDGRIAVNGQSNLEHSSSLNRFECTLDLQARSCNIRCNKRH